MADDDLIHLEHAAELSTLAGALEAAGFATHLLERGDGLELTTLMVAFGKDDEDRDRAAAISIMPFSADQLAATQFTQFYMPMPFKVGDARAEVAQAASIVNVAMAVGHFAVRDDELFYRYMLASPRGASLDPDMVAELVTMLQFHQEHFGDYLEGVNDGEIDLSVLPDVIAQTS
jgi:hypothetical protein